MLKKIEPRTDLSLHPGAQTKNFSLFIIKKSPSLPYFHHAYIICIAWLIQCWATKVMFLNVAFIGGGGRRSSRIVSPAWNLAKPIAPF